MKTAKEILTNSEKFKVSLDTKRVQDVLELLGNPQDKYKCFHIAGTNGKGSTAKIINDILVENFKNTDTKIGLFTSPHLVSYTERIKINNENISSFVFDSLVNNVDDFAKKNNIELTEFEIITVVAFYYFYLKKVKYVILETGLGGLFDATNVIKKSFVDIITTIDFDHTEKLGDTIDKIAVQKAGIIKEKSKVVISPNNSGYKEVLKIAKEKKATIEPVPEVKIINKNNSNIAAVKYSDSEKEYKFNLFGSHQADNLSLALGAINASKIKVSQKAITNALEKITWKYRLEYQPDKNLLIDGAHNPSGIKALRNYLDENYKKSKKTFVFGCLKNKDYPKMLDILLKENDEFYFYEFDYPNALKYENLDEKFKKNAHLLKNISEVKKLIENNKNLKIVCGSLYMLGQLNPIL